MRTPSKRKPTCRTETKPPSAGGRYTRIIHAVLGTIFLILVVSEKLLDVLAKSKTIGIW